MKEEGGRGGGEVGEDIEGGGGEWGERGGLERVCGEGRGE